MKKKIVFGSVLAVLMGIMVTGCSTYYFMDLESFSSGKDATAYTYHIISGNSAVSSDDLKFVSMKNILKKSLLESGFKVSDSEKDTDAVILFTASISEPNTKMTGTSSSYYSSSNTSSTSVSYSTTYIRKVKLDVYEWNSNTKKQGSILWKLDGVSEGTSNDLQSILRIFSEKVMKKYYGRDSGGVKKTSVELKPNGEWGAVSAP